MAIHRRPPHPMRGPLILLLLLALLVAGMVAIASSVREQPVRPIEVDVSRAQPS